MQIIDLRSDTVTKPTLEMRQAMFDAPVGDDVYGEDPTVIELESTAARILGKEAALYVTTGTMGNLVALMAHTKRGDEVILEEESHIYYYEVAGMSVAAQTLPRLIRGDRFKIVDPDVLKAAIRAANIHYAPATLLCLENTHNRGGGTIYTPERMAELYKVAKDHGLNVHLDGARVFNAAVALGVDIKEITKSVDSVQVCLSKGLCAPVGSIVAGSKEFIDKARKNRKMVGGGMRQAGVIAAAGLYGITKMVSRLKEDHNKAQVLAKGLSQVKGIKIDLEAVQTNIVSYDVSGTGMTAPEYVKKLLQNGVKCGNQTNTRVRMVCHHDVSMEDVNETVAIVNKAVNS